MIRTQLASGRLVSVRHGVLVAAEGWPDDPAGQHLVRARAELVANPGAVISHESAAVAWRLATPGFTMWHEHPVSLTSPGRTSHRSRRGSAVWHSGDLAPGLISRDEEGYDVTSVARTAVDLAAGLSLPEALVILDDAARRIVGSFLAQPRRLDYQSPRLVRAARESLVSSATPAGRRLLRHVIDLVEPCRESAAESLTAGHLELSGLARPVFQALIRTPAGALYPDFLWRDAILVGECDGAVKYKDTSSILLEKEREQVLKDLGYRVVRWLAKEIMLRPEEVLDRIDRALRSS